MPQSLIFMAVLGQITLMTYWWCANQSDNDWKSIQIKEQEFIIFSTTHKVYKQPNCNPSRNHNQLLLSNWMFTWKTKNSKIILLHKGGPRLDITNYRPIPLLPFVSWVFQQCILTRLKPFLESKKIIFQHQHGVQKNKSTTLAVLDLLNNIIGLIWRKHFFNCSLSWPRKSLQ